MANDQIRVAKASTLRRSPTKPCTIHTPKANDHDLGVLVALADAARRFSMGRGREFVRPMDIGGSARRNVSPALARLEKLGLVASRPRELSYSVGPYPPSRTSREYKATDAGLAAARDYDSRINASLTCPHNRKGIDQ